MKKNSFVILLLPFLLSCARNENNTGSANHISPDVKKQVTDIAIQYTMDKSKDTKKTIAKNGIVTISDNQLSYVIDPAGIVTGLIDNDAEEDAIISVLAYNGQIPVIPEHLLLLKTFGKLKLSKVFKADIKIIGIKKGIIFAAIPKVDPDAPTHDCTKCKEIVKYRYKNGNLEKTE